MTGSGREYPGHPRVGIGVVLLRRGAGSDPGQVVLVRRSKPPAAGTWSIPGGAQELGETAEAAARRELLEETGLQAGALHLVANVDSIHRDAEGRVRFHYTILDFAAEWQGGEPRAGDDAAACCFAPLDALGPYGLWDEAHRVIALARRKLGL